MQFNTKCYQIAAIDQWHCSVAVCEQTAILWFAVENMHGKQGLP
jgi:hypothetical protein